MIVLHEPYGLSYNFFKANLVKTLKKKPSFITIHFRFDEDDIGNGK